MRPKDKACLEMLAVSNEDPVEISKFLHEPFGSHVTYPVAQDPDSKLSRALEVTGIPRTLIINPKGEVVYDMTGQGTGDLFVSTLKDAGFPVRRGS